MKKFILLGLVTFTGISGAFSQATNDAGLWATFNFQKKLNDKFSFFLTEEFRLRENFSRVNLFYTDLGIEVRPAKFLKVALGYRLTEKNQVDNTFSYRHRLMLDITLRKKLSNFALSYRHRLQTEYRDVNSSELGMVPEWYSRSKFTIKYDSEKKLTPYISAEFRYQIKNAREVELDGVWHRGRYALGFDYKSNDRDTFGLYYLIQNEFNASAPENLYIVGLEYSISL